MREYVPTARQAAFHDDPHERRWLCAGYGSSKTTVAVMEAVRLALYQHPGYTGIACAPTFGILDQGFLTEWQRWVPAGAWKRKGALMQGAELLVRCPGGETSTILLRSTRNIASLESINAAWCVFDEATREPRQQPYSVLSARLRRGYPGRQRPLVVCGYPMGRSHWTSKEFGAGPDAKHDGDAMQWHDAEQAVIRARTIDNPHLPEGYDAKQRNRPGASKAWCRQFLDAQIGAIEGAVYAAFDRDVHVVAAESLVRRSWAVTGCGVDWGWEHPGVMLAGSTDGLGDLYITHEEVHQHRVVADVSDGWLPIARTLARVHGVGRFACDPSRPGEIVTLHRCVREYGARAFDADNEVAEGIRRVEARLEAAVDRGRAVAPRVRRPALYVSDACPHLIEELESYTRETDRWGELTDTPLKRKDDAVDALRYLVMDLTRE